MESCQGHGTDAYGFPACAITVAVKANDAAGNKGIQTRLFRLSFDSPGGTSMLGRKELVTFAVKANDAAGNEATQTRFFRLCRLSFNSPGGTSMLGRKELVVILIYGPITFT
eukprot:scaffold6466_cov38-Attheya_sp.AAC.8